MSGLVGVVVLPTLVNSKQTPPALPAQGAKQISPGPRGLDVRGTLHTTAERVILKDLEGGVVLEIRELAGMLDLHAAGSGLVRMPGGRVEGIKLLLRRGASGRVSLAEVLGARGENGRRGETLLDIGPLDLRDAHMKVAMGGAPVEIQIDEATVRVQRDSDDRAPTIYLSNLRGHMLKPDPLPKPVRIHGGQGVVRLAGNPLIDFRTRVCVGEDELHLRIEMEQRRGQVQLTADASGFLSGAARVGLKIASLLKPDKLVVDSGVVSVQRPQPCSDEGKP